MLGRILFRLVVFGGILALVAGPVRDTLSAEGDRPAARIPTPPTEGLPPQIGHLVQQVSSAQRQSLAGRLHRLAGGGGEKASTAPGRDTGPRPFADRGTRRQIVRLRRDVVDALRRASTSNDRLTVVAWQGVYVSGRRAAALVDLRRSVRTRRGLPFRRLPIERTRIGLVREGRRWLVAAGAPGAG